MMLLALGLVCLGAFLFAGGMLDMTLGDWYHSVVERARSEGYDVRIGSVPQIGPGHWLIMFCVMSWDDVREHPDASLRKDFRHFHLDIDGCKGALAWLGTRRMLS